jgi:hypothetical protein
MSDEALRIAKIAALRGKYSGAGVFIDEETEVRLATLREVREAIDSHIGTGKPGWLQGFNYMKEIALMDIDVLIDKEEGKQ